MTHPETSGTSAAPRRGGALRAMAIGAAVGLVAGQAIESAMAGADPAFAGAIGGALGAALGRSGWMRVSAARARRQSVPLVLAALAGRIAGCALVGVGLVARLQGTGAPPLTEVQQTAIIVAGVALLVGTAVVEQRWLRRAVSPGGPSHGA